MITGPEEPARSAELADDRGRDAGSAAGARVRVRGIDLARALAIVGMMAAHIFSSLADDRPTLTTMLAAGRSATLFAVVAGVSLAFLTGARTPLTGRARTRASAGIAARGAAIGLLGLVLAYLEVADVILSTYGLLFVLALPLLGLRPARLAAVAACLALIGPVLLIAAAGSALPYAGDSIDPTLDTLVWEPVALACLLVFTGHYPAVVYLAYVCVGLALGRLDLGSRRVAIVLLVGGAALALVAKAVSGLLLYPLGGLRALVRAGDESARELLWAPGPGDSWWYLALSSPHSHTTLDVAHTLGSAAAIIGCCLLVMRAPALAGALRPLAALGSMPLTIYTGHLLVLAVAREADGFDGDSPGGALLLFAVLVVGSTIFATWWLGRFRRGPLELALAAVSERAAAAAGRSGRPGEPRGPVA